MGKLLKELIEPPLPVLHNSGSVRTFDGTRATRDTYWVVDDMSPMRKNELRMRARDIFRDPDRPGRPLSRGTGNLVQALSANCQVPWGVGLC